MKKNILIAIFFAAVAAGCNNNNSKQPEPDNLKANADSLFEEVMDGHDIGMAKMNLLEKMENAAKASLDSISKLPAKAREAATPYKAKLDSLMKDLSYAQFAMNKWMEDFKYDSAKNDLQQRIRYLTDENSKVGKVKEAILGSLKKADSVLKKNMP
jgi:hypothetical protein